MATTTIRSTREIDAVFQEARRVAHPLVIALISKTPEGRGPQGRVAFIAGKRLGGAVSRNRGKRVLRETVRRSGRSWPGYDVLLVARSTTMTAPAVDLDRALANVLDRGGLE